MRTKKLRSKAEIGNYRLGGCQISVVEFCGWCTFCCRHRLDGIGSLRNIFVGSRFQTYNSELDRSLGFQAKLVPRIRKYKLTVSSRDCE
jgi:hypothetical protein